MSCAWLFEPVSFVWYQDKRPGVVGANIYKVFYGLLAPETDYNTGNYLGSKNTKIF